MDQQLKIQKWWKIKRISKKERLHHKIRSHRNVYLFIDSTHKQMNNLIDLILSLIETSSARLSSWAWTKRWKNRDEGYGYKKTQRFRSRKI